MASLLSRRGVLGTFGALSAVTVFGSTSFAKTSARVVVVGGGFGGATAARFLKRLSPRLEITLIEQDTDYIACPFSNLVIGGTRDISQQTYSYGALAREGLTVVRGRATDVDASAKSVTLEDGNTFAYDRLILSPGIDFRWDALEGYEVTSIEAMPHAWKAGVQTTLLRRQLEAMEDGGTVVMSVPAMPYRCPPGPYERASLIANYLKVRKPRSKLIVLDSKDQFSKQPLFEEAWAAHYPEILEWRSASSDGRVSRVDPAQMTIETDFDTIKADVANIIPPQKAGDIASRAGVTDATGWCPIDAVSFESTLAPGIHIVGDATIAAPVPKSAFAANAQGKVCAIQVARLLAGEAPEAATLANTCYSFVSPDEAVSIVGVYSTQGGAFGNVEGAGGLSPLLASHEERAREAIQAADWYRAITTEAFL